MIQIRKYRAETVISTRTCRVLHTGVSRSPHERDENSTRACGEHTNYINYMPIIVILVRKQYICKNAIKYMYLSNNHKN